MSTTQVIQNGLKTAAKIAGALLGQIILFAAIGILLNLIFIPFIWHEFMSLIPSTPVQGTWYNKALVYSSPALLLLTFVLIFPIIYFLAGKKQGIKAAISKLVHEKSDSVIYFIISKFTDKLAAHPEWKQSIDKNGIAQTVKNIFPGFLKTLQGIPSLLKRPLGIIFKGVDLATAVEQAYRSRPDLPINDPQTIQHITSQLTTQMKQKFQPPKGKLLLVIILLNVVVFITLKICL